MVSSPGVHQVVHLKGWLFDCRLWDRCSHAISYGSKKKRRRQDLQRNAAPVYPERKLSIRSDPSSAACVGSAPPSLKYGNLVERDHGRPEEGAARFHPVRWTIVMRAALRQMQWRQSALAGLCWLYWSPLYIFARRRGYSPAEINEEIDAFCEALIGTGGRLGP